MNCPACGTEMRRGQVSVHGTALGFLFIGLSHQHCWFEEFERNTKEKVIVPSNGSRPACSCPKCSAVVILQKAQESEGLSKWIESE
jgi:hypothetical protein